MRGEKNIGKMQGLAIALLGSKSQDDDRGNVLGAGVVPGNLSQQAMTMELDSSDILSSSRLPCDFFSIWLRMVGSCILYVKIAYVG